MKTSTGADIKSTALLAATVSAFLTPFMGSAIFVALPSIGREFSMDAVLLGWVATVYLLTSAMFLLPVGRVADIHGRKRVFIFGMSLFVVSSFILVVARSDWMFISFRALQGIAGSMISGSGVAILTSVFPPQERGKVLGINTASVYTGLSLGPVVGGFLTQHFGWRSLFLLSIFLGLMIVTLVVGKLKGEWAGARGEKFDLKGAAMYGLSLVPVMYGFSILPSMGGAALIAAGALGMLAFVKWEMRAPSPVVDVRILKTNPVFAFSNLAALSNYICSFGSTFLLSLYLQYVKGMEPSQAGLMLIVQPVVMAVVAPFAGRLSDKVEPRILSSIGLACTTLGMALLTTIGPDTSLGLFAVLLALLGLGFSLFSSPNTNAVMSSVGKSFLGVAAATIATMRVTGMVFGMGIIVLIFALFIGRQEITPQYYPAFLSSARVAFAVFAAFCFGGIFASLKRGKIR